jgi:tetratricopeptide (TPR) repeat protein
MEIGMRILACLLALAFAASAQSILMRDGKRVTAKTLRRQGDNIMAGSPSVDGAAALQGEVGYPLAQIERLEFPEPAVLKTAPEQIAAGKAAEALTALEPVINYYAGFRDAPGSYWPDVALLKLAATVALGRDAEAEPLARQITGQATNPETVRAAQSHLAGISARKGDHEAAIKLCDQILKDGQRPETLAVAAINKGQSHFALKQWEKALLAFLQIPVFYPEQKTAIPPYLLGAAQCWFELADYPRAKEALAELAKNFPNSREAELAKAEVEKIARREKALQAAQ